MPLPRARRRSSKRTRRRIVSKVMHELKHHGKRHRSRKQRIAIALKQAGLSRRHRPRRKK